MSAQHCLDCKKDTYKIREYYMVTNRSWRKANPAEKGMLCIGCLEERLGRKLDQFKDFIWCPLNVWNVFHGSDRLKDRLGAKYVFDFALD
jgi:hypothetical protein